MSSMNVSILVSIAFVLIFFYNRQLKRCNWSLQLAANVIVDVVNASGSLIYAHLQDIPARVQEIALHGVRHGASVALTAA